MMLAFFLYLLAGFYFLFAEEPWSISQKNPITQEVFIESKTKAKDSSVSHYLFTFYQKYISPIDGQICHYSPTCSQYSYEALKKYGIIRAFLMTTDRLIRCHEGQKEHPYDPPKWY